jgi:hypothetical protein
MKHYVNITADEIKKNDVIYVLRGTRELNLTVTEKINSQGCIFVRLSDGTSQWIFPSNSIAKLVACS